MYQHKLYIIQYNIVYYILYTICFCSLFFSHHQRPATKRRFPTWPCSNSSTKTSSLGRKFCASGETTTLAWSTTWAAEETRNWDPSGWSKRVMEVMLLAIMWIIWGFPEMGVPPKCMVYKGKSHQNGWFRGAPILGNLHIFFMTFSHVWCFSALFCWCLVDYTRFVHFAWLKLGKKHPSECLAKVGIPSPRIFDSPQYTSG